MCHEVPLEGRLHEGRPTLPPAELLLTKLQIVKLNDKDRLDAYAILLHHEVDEHDEQAVNIARVAEVCGRDWGLWRTTHLTLDRLEAGLDEAPLTPDERALIAERVQRIRSAIDRAPKALAWKVRARVGERVRWYEDPDEVAGGGF